MSAFKPRADKRAGWLQYYSMFYGVRRSVAILILILGSLSVLADGKVFRHVEMATGPVTIPDQRALIHWSNGVERLVIETSFQGSGSNFA